jgi:hypothetical protein
LESMRNGGLARLRLVLVLTIGVAVAAALVAAGAGQAQEETSASEDSSVGAQSVIPDDPDGEPRRHLVPTEDGVKIKPILSTGDIVVDPEGARNEYQMSGIPDGLGAYKSDKGMLKVLMNHKLDGTPPDSPEGVGARPSRLSLDPETLTVESASSTRSRAARVSCVSAPRQSATSTGNRCTSPARSRPTREALPMTPPTVSVVGAAPSC